MRFLLLIIFISAKPCLAQEMYIEDTSATKVAWEHVMKEIEIVGLVANHKNAAFDFYKTSDLASTEEVISRIPGFSLIRRGNYGMEPIYRGMSGNRINITIDGMRVSAACTDKMDPITSYIEPENLSTMSINTAGDVFPSTAGSLNLGMARPSFLDQNKWVGTVSSRFQTNAPGFANNLNLNYSKGKIALRMSGVYRKSGDYMDGEGELVPYSYYNKANASVSAKIKMNNNRMLDLDFLIDHAWQIGYPALPMDVSFARAKIFGIGYQQHFSNANLKCFSFKVYGNQINHQMDDSNRPDVEIKMDMPGKARTLGTLAELEFTSFVNHELKLKGEFYQSYSYAEMTMFAPEEKDMFMLTWPGITQNMAALSIGQDFKWKKYRLQVNGRTDFSHTAMDDELGWQQFSVFYAEKPDPKRIIINVNASIKREAKRFSSTISLSRSERLPDASEQFGFYLFNKQDNHDYLGQPFLKTEKALIGEVSSSYRNKHFSVQGTLFSYWFQDYISVIYNSEYLPMTPGSAGVKEYQNLERAMISGFEMLANLHFWEKFTAIGSATYVRGTDDVENPLPQISPFKTLLTFNYSNNNLNLQVEGEYNAKQSRISNWFNERATDGYFLLNLRGSRTFKLNEDYFKISVGVENVGDIHYRDHLDWGEIYRPGRNFNLGLSYQF